MKSDKPESIELINQAAPMIIARSTVGDEGMEAKLEVGRGVHKVQKGGLEQVNGCIYTVS